METPYAGRAIITDHFDHVEIVIPTKKNVLNIAFICIWMCFWVIGETTGATSFGFNEGVSIFSTVWLCAWTFGGCAVLVSLWWQLFGKEIIEAGQGAITIRRKGALFAKDKTYDINEVKNFRVQADSQYYSDGWGNNRRRNAFFDYNSGTIKFDYGMQTIKFGNNLEEAEASNILRRLKEKRILTEKNF